MKVALFILKGDIKVTTKKVFLAGPFKSLVDVNTGLMSLHEREKLESLISFFVK